MAFMEFLKFPARSTFPATGDSNRLYIDLSSGKLYYWHAGAYQIASGDLLETDSEFLSNAQQLIQSLAEHGIAQTDTISEDITLEITDVSKLFLTNSTSATSIIAITVPTHAVAAIPVGATVSIIQIGDGLTKLVESQGVTILKAFSTLNLSGKGSCVNLKKIEEDKWVAYGDLTDNDFFEFYGELRTYNAQNFTLEPIFNNGVVTNYVNVNVAKIKDIGVSMNYPATYNGKQIIYGGYSGGNGIFSKVPHSHITFENGALCHSNSSLFSGNNRIHTVRGIPLDYHYNRETNSASLNRVFTESSITQVSHWPAHINFQYYLPVFNYSLEVADIDGKHIHGGLFSYCNRLTTVTGTPNFNKYMANTFLGCKKLVTIGNLTEINIPSSTSSTSFVNLFSGCSNISLPVKIYPQGDPSQNTAYIDISSMFNECYNIPSIEFMPGAWGRISNAINTFRYCEKAVFNGDYKNIFNGPERSDKFRNIYGMFSFCRNLISGPNLSFINAPTEASNMFSGCLNLIDVEASFSPTATHSVNMSFMFNSCLNLINPPSFAAYPSNLSGVFANCFNIITVPNIPNSTTDIAFAFMKCNKIENAPTIGAKVTNMHGAFMNCTNLVAAPNIPNKVTTGYQAFKGCVNLQVAENIGEDTSSVLSNSIQMFDGCSNLTGNIKVWSNRMANGSMSSMFLNTNASLAKSVIVPATGLNATHNTINTALNATTGINGKNGVTVTTFE